MSPRPRPSERLDLTGLDRAALDEGVLEDLLRSADAGRERSAEEAHPMLCRLRDTPVLGALASHLPLLRTSLRRLRDEVSAEDEMCRLATLSITRWRERQSAQLVPQTPEEEALDAQFDAEWAEMTAAAERGTLS